MDPIRIGIIGYGNMGSAHASCIADGGVKGMVLAALCDPDQEARKRGRERHPQVPFYRHAEELFAAGVCDAVILATPHKAHPPLAKAAFACGLHVLTEKPAGVDLPGVEEMMEAARVSGKAFGIMLNQRTNPLFQRARALLQEGALGTKIRLHWQITNWYRPQSYYDSGSWRATWEGEGGGVLLNQAPHHLDLWQWIFGMPTRLWARCAVGKYHNIEVEDEAMLYAEYEDGETAVFLTSTGEYPGTNRLEISGDLGKIVLEEGRMKWWRLTAPEREFCYTLPQGAPLPEVCYEEWMPEEPETGHQGILQNFANHLLFGEPLLAPGEDGWKELAISNAAYLSSWTDSWVSVPCDREAFAREFAKRVCASCPHGASEQREAYSAYADRWQVRW